MIFRAERSPRLWALFVLAPLASCASVEPNLRPAHFPSLADHPLSRQECIDLAASSAPTVAAWEARLSKARAALDKARTLPNPTLLLEWEDLGLDHGPDAVPPQKTRSVLVSLADLLAMPWRIDAAEFDAEAEAAHVAAEQQQLAKSVAHDFDDLIVLHRKAALLHEATEIATKQRAAIEEFARLGQFPRIASERAEAEQLDAAAEEAAAVAATRLATIRFAFALGFDRPVALELADRDAPDASAVASPSDLESLLAEAAAARPEMKEALAKYRATLERQRLADLRIELLPTIGVGHRRQSTATSEVASIEVGLPLFDRGDNAVLEASAELLDAAANLRAVAATVTSEIAIAHASFEAATAYLANHAEPLARVRESLRDGTEKLFRAGEATIEDWITTRRDEVKARLAREEARAAVAAANIDLVAALGRLQPTPVPAVPSAK